MLLASGRYALLCIFSRPNIFKFGQESSFTKKHKSKFNTHMTWQYVLNVNNR